MRHLLTTIFDLPTQVNEAIVITGQKLEKDLRWPKRVFTGTVAFQDCVFSLLDWKWCKFQGPVSFHGCRFESTFIGMLNEFAGPVTFSDCDFAEEVYLLENCFHQPVQWERCRFGPQVAIQSTFKQSLFIRHCQGVQTRLLLSRSHFYQGCELDHSKFAEEVNFDPKLTEQLVSPADDAASRDLVRDLNFSERFYHLCRKIALSASAGNRNWGKEIFAKALVDSDCELKEFEAQLPAELCLLPALASEAQESKAVIEGLLANTHQLYADLLATIGGDLKNGNATEVIEAWLKKLRSEYQPCRWSLLAHTIASFSEANFLVPSSPELVREALERSELYAIYCQWQGQPLPQPVLDRIRSLAIVAPLCFFAKPYLDKMRRLLQLATTAAPTDPVPCRLSPPLYGLWQNMIAKVVRVDRQKQEALKELLTDLDIELKPEQMAWPEAAALAELAELLPASLVAVPDMDGQKDTPAGLIRFALGSCLPGAIVTALLSWSKDFCQFTDLAGTASYDENAKKSWKKAQGVWPVDIRNILEKGLLASPCYALLFLRHQLRNVKANVNSDGKPAQVFGIEEVNHAADFFLAQCYGILFDGAAHERNDKTLSPEFAWAQFEQCSQNYIAAYGKMFVRDREPYTMSLGKLSLKNLETKRLILDNAITFGRIEIQECQIGELSGQRSWFGRGTTEAAVRITAGNIGSLNFNQSLVFAPLTIEDSEIKSHLRLELASLSQGLTLKNLRIHGALLLAGTTFHGAVKITKLPALTALDLRDILHLNRNGQPDQARLVIREVQVQGEFNASGACCLAGMEITASEFQDKFWMIAAFHLHDLYLSPRQQANRYRNCFRDEVVLNATSVLGRLSLDKAKLEMALQARSLYAHILSLADARLDGAICINPAYLGRLDGQHLDLVGTLEGSTVTAGVIDLEAAQLADTCDFSQAAMNRLAMFKAHCSGTVNIEEAKLDKLVLAKARCEQDLLLRKIVLGHLELNGIRLQGDLRLEQATVTQVVKATQMAVQGKVIAAKASLTSSNFSGCQFANQTKFVKAGFIGLTQFDRCVFAEYGDFSQATFQHPAAGAESDEPGNHKSRRQLLVSFAHSFWKAPALFNDAEFFGPASFEKTNFQSLVSFKDAKFPTQQDRKSYASLYRLLKTGAAPLYTVNLSKCTFGTEVDFTGAKFDFLYLCDATLPGKIVLTWPQFAQQTYVRLDLAAKNIYLQPVGAMLAKDNAATEEEPCQARPVAEEFKGEIGLLEEVLERQHDRRNKDRLVMRSRSLWLRPLLGLTHTYSYALLYLVAMVTLLFGLNFLWFSQIHRLSAVPAAEAAWGNCFPILFGGEMTSELQVTPPQIAPSHQDQQFAGNTGSGDTGSGQYPKWQELQQQLAQLLSQHQQLFRRLIQFLHALFSILTVLVIGPSIAVMLSRKTGM